MFNKLMRRIFNSSTLIPLALVVGIKFFFNKNFIMVGILILISAISLIVPWSMLKYAKANLVEKPINITKISKKEGEWKAIIFPCYIVPIVDALFQDVITDVSIGILVVFALVLIFSSSETSNFALKIFGYEVYSIETKHGVDMILLSKSDLRNKKSVKNIIRLFSNCIMEVRA